MERWSDGAMTGLAKHEPGAVPSAKRYFESDVCRLGARGLLEEEQVVSVARGPALDLVVDAIPAVGGGVRGGHPAGRLE